MFRSYASNHDVFELLAASHDGPTRSSSIFGWLFDTSNFPQRWYCGTWSDALGYTHIVSDLLTWGAYTAIPLVLAFYIRRRPDTPFPAIFWLFAAFIFCCGSVHLIEAIIFYEPIYNLSAVIKALTAAVSWATVFALIPAVPRALELPGLAEVNRRLEREIDGHTHAKEELAQRNRDLQNLLFIVSHDLREPARAVTAFTDLFATHMEGKLDERGTDFLGRIQRNGQRLHRLLDDIVLLSHARSEEYARSDVSLRDVVSAILAEQADRVRDLGAVVHVDEDLPTVLANRKWATLAIGNLIGNALKFTKPDEPPHVEIRRYRPQQGEPAQPGLVVRDRGVGVRPDEAEQIFELFRRGASSRRAPGEGAGLAIVREIALRHGGRSWARTHVRDGAEFVMTFGEGRDDRKARPT